MSSLDPSDFDVVAASLRSDSDDWQTYMAYLATKMTAALPMHTKVERKGLFKNGPPRKVAVTLGDHAYIVEEYRGSLSASRNRVVGGVEISHEPMDLTLWADQLVSDLRTLASRSADHRRAIEKLTLG